MHHPTAIVEGDVGPDTSIWQFSKVMKGAYVGARCTLGQNVTVEPEASVGNGCKIQNNVSVYGGVHLEDDVFVGPSAVFTNVRVPRAAHPTSYYVNTFVRRGASIGANATIVCGVEIGAYALVGSGAVVIHDVPKHAVVVGNPARVIAFVCKCGKERVPVSKVCGHTCACMS